MGAWTYIEPRIEEVLSEIGGECRRPAYVGRPEAAAPATGLLRRHVEEQKALVAAALTVDGPARKSGTGSGPSTRPHEAAVSLDRAETGDERTR